MSKFVVTVDSDVYKGEYFGESLELSETNDEVSVIVNEEDGSFTAHRLENVLSIDVE
jgi:hypothetical protein